MSTLIVVECGSWSAVYSEDSQKRLYYGDRDLNDTLLRALGYTLVREEPVPTYDIRPPYDKDDKGQWQPPELLATLRAQREEVRSRRRQQRIAMLESELARLREEEQQTLDGEEANGESNGEANGVTSKSPTSNNSEVPTCQR